jgi:nuclear inhibitor of protein phosphatase 1
MFLLSSALEQKSLFYEVQHYWFCVLLMPHWAISASDMEMIASYFLNIIRFCEVWKFLFLYLWHSCIFYSIYVMDLGSAHGTFVANERLTKDSPVELEVGQSLRFAASTRTYILRKNEAALFTRPPLPAEIDLQPPPDPSDEEAVVAYNTLLNRYGLSKPDRLPKSTESGRSKGGRDNSQQSERLAKRLKKLRVSFRDQFGGELVEVVGVSDGADVETEPGPLGVKEGSLVGKYEHLVQVTVIPKGKQQSSAKEDTTSQKGVTDKLQEVLNRVKTTPKSGIYDDLYGESFSVKVGSSWAYPSVSSDGKSAYPTKDTHGKVSSGNSSHVDDESDDDLFGD